MIYDHLAVIAALAISELYGVETESSSVTVQVTPENFEGDYTIVLFPFLKQSRKSPQETGTELGERMALLCQEIGSWSVVKGYLNLTLKDSFWLSFLKEESSNDKFGLRQPDNDIPPVLVEFSSPNTNKPLHLGHIRNNLLGDAVSAILEANGQKIIKVNLVNDRGIHICKSMLGWLKFAKGKTPELTGLKGDKFVGDYYVAFDRAYKEELSRAADSGLSEEEAEISSVWMQEARAMLRHWEEGEEQTRALWKLMNDWVYQGFEATYERLGIRFDKTYYESDTYKHGKKLVLEGVDRGLLEKRTDGSVWIDLSEAGMDEKLLLRSDGTSVYITQDIGTAMIRDEEYHPSKMIYVVGNEQNYHFEVLKKVLERLEYPIAGKIHHLSYGMVRLPSGKMKSREGTVVDADDLMDEMREAAAKVTAELGKWSEDELKELDDLFEILGLGALKYFILKVAPVKDMLFNPEESIDFNGNTGPFIQYTHARISSLMEKAKESGVSYKPLDAEETYSFDDVERSLLKTIYSWPTVLTEAGLELNPALIANYCYDLARDFNQFYHNLSVLSAETAQQVNVRLSLTEFTGHVLRSAMGLLGITLPDRM